MEYAFTKLILAAGTYSQTKLKISKKSTEIFFITALKNTPRLIEAVTKLKSTSFFSIYFLLLFFYILIS